MSVETVWQEALQYIQAKVPRQVYDNWFIPAQLDRIEDSTAHIGVPNKFFGDWLHTHYAQPAAGNHLERNLTQTATGLASESAGEVNDCSA